MLLRKQMRSVREITTVYLHVILVNGTRRMYDTLRVRTLTTKPPILSALTRPAAGINGCSKPQPDQMKLTFRELVFSARGAMPSEQDAREEEEYNVSQLQRWTSSIFVHIIIAIAFRPTSKSWPSSNRTGKAYRARSALAAIRWQIHWST